MKTEKRLSQDKVTTYAKLCAEYDALKKRKEKMRIRLIEQMEAGYVCPKAGPYLVMLTYQEKHPVAWKEEWIKLYKRAFGAGWKKQMKRLISMAEVVKTPMLLPRVNPKYRIVEHEKVLEFKERRSA